MNGTWISAYTYEKNKPITDTLTGIPFNQIISFQDNVYRFKEFKYDFHDNEGTEEFELKGNRLIFNKEKYSFDTIEPITKDSIVIKNTNPRNKVYKRLNDSLKNHSNDYNFLGKKFVRNYRNWTDTIQFVNDSVYISSNWKMDNTDLMWERINYNGFDILFTSIYPPFVIKKKIDNKIYISTFGTIKEDYIIKEIQ